MVRWMAKGRESAFWDQREIVVALEAQTRSRKHQSREKIEKTVFWDHREIVLALKAEGDLSGSLGRKRKFDGNSKRLRDKRFRVSGGNQLNEPNNGELAIEQEKSVRKEPPELFTCSSLAPKAATIVVNGESEVRNFLSTEKRRKNKSRFSRKEGTCVESPVVVDDYSEVQNDSTIRPTRRITRSLLKTKPKSMGTNKKFDVKNNAFMKKPPMESTNLDLEQEIQPMVLDNDKEECNTSSVKPLKQYSRSALKHKAKHLVVDGNKKAQNASEDEKFEDHVKNPITIDSEVNNTLMVKPLRRFTRSSLKPVAKPMVVHENRGVFAKNGEVQNSNPKVKFTCSTLEPDAEVVVIAGSGQDQNFRSEKPHRQSTNHSVEVNGTPLLLDGKHNVQNTLPDKPMMRLTRSALKLSDRSTTHDNECEQLGVVNSGGLTTDTVRSLKTPPKQKLEMKMSKKISLNKLPSKIKELLETGLLEGLPVKYILVGNKDCELRGTIKDRGILCFCVLCEGCKVISPIQFERHAGTKTGNPADYIYLDNGKSLNDILTACESAPLDTLEAIIQCEINSSTLKRSTCLNCERPLPTIRTRMAVSLCRRCMESKRTQAKVVYTSGTISRSPNSSNVKPMCALPQSNKRRGKLTRKDLRLHKLVFEEDGLPDGSELAYYARGQKVLEGYKKGFGIFCHCCKTEISPSQFEAHAGFAARRKPYLHIYTSNGVSLHELSISLSKGRKFSVNDNDDLCSICADFGDLLLCDGCPRAFHKECVGESSIPRGDWYCSYCQLMFEREKSNMHNANAKAAGRVLGVDSIKQISKRCIRIVQTLETEVGGCSLCRCPGFSKSGFGLRTIILCDQCEKEFHVGCLKDHKMANLKELPEGKWFCCASCRRIDTTLQKMILSGQEKLPDSTSNIIRKKQVEKCSSSDADLDIRWRVLRGKIASPDSRLLLSKAVSIFHNRFDPIVDSITGRDLIPSMVYGRNVRGQEFGGMHCAVLTVNSSVVSAGIFRVFGQELAELPLVATSNDYQGKGYFQSLFYCIEKLLGSLKVKNLVLPAATEAEAIWTDKFGFKKMSDDQLSMYRKDYQMTAFQGTSMLLKSILSCSSTSKRNKEC